MDLPGRVGVYSYKGTVSTQLQVEYEDGNVHTIQMSTFKFEGNIKSEQNNQNTVPIAWHVDNPVVDIRMRVSLSISGKGVFSRAAFLPPPVYSYPLDIPAIQ